MSTCLTLSDAQRILSTEPQAMNRAALAAFTALNTANHLYSIINPYGTDLTLPDLNTEMLAFRQRMKGVDQFESYIIAVEAETHFTLRLREAETRRDAADKAHFNRNMRARLDEIHLAQQREWREKHGKMLDDVCRDLISEIDMVRHDISTALMPIDLQTMRDKLSSDLQAASAAVDNIEIN